MLEDEGEGSHSRATGHTVNRKATSLIDAATCSSGEG